MKTLKKTLAAILAVTLILLTLVSCNTPTCKKHTDANDDGICDTEGCNEAYSDGCDVKECADADGDSKCDACGQEVKTEEEKEDTPSFTLVLFDQIAVEYEIELDKISTEGGLFAALDYLKLSGKLDYKADSTGYLTEVGDIKQDYATGKYLYVYTSVEEDFDVGMYAKTYEYGDMTLTSSGFGASDMHIYDDAVILITYIIWG